MMILIVMTHAAWMNAALLPVSHSTIPAVVRDHGDRVALEEIPEKKVQRELQVILEFRGQREKKVTTVSQKQ